MTDIGKGKADYLELGDWNAVCFECGRKFKASMMKKHWQGYWVCPEHWEPRHPQDFVRAIREVQAPPWTQPMPADSFIEPRGYLTLLQDDLSMLTQRDMYLIRIL